MTFLGIEKIINSWNIEKVAWLSKVAWPFIKYFDQTVRILKKVASMPAYPWVWTTKEDNYSISSPAEVSRLILSMKRKPDFRETSGCPRMSRLMGRVWPRKVSYPPHPHTHSHPHPHTHIHQPHPCCTLDFRERDTQSAGVALLKQISISWYVIEREDSLPWIPSWSDR